MAEKNDIQSYLEVIRNASDGESVRDAIIACMNFINSDTAVELYTRTITKTFSANGTFHEQYPAIQGKAYKGVNLDITIDVEGGGGGGGSQTEETSYTHVDAPINNDTQNGSYTASDFGGDIIDHVVVEMDMIRPERIIDNIAIDISQLSPEGIFDAAEEGYYAMQSITILNAGTGSGGGGGGSTILPNGQTGWNYKFYTKPSGTATSADCPTGWSGVYQAGTCPPLPINVDEKIMPNVPPGYSWNGWTPSYQSGKAYNGNLNFYPVFTPNTYGGDTINDSWADIIQNRATPYSIGDTKTLVLEAHLTDVEDPNIPAGDSYDYALIIPMILVSKGESGTSSTWISKYIDYDSSPLVPPFVPADTFDYLDSPTRFTSWNAAGLKFLNGTFMNSIIKKVENGALYNGIKSVSKTYIEGIKSTSTTYIGIGGHVTAQHSSKIWIPSDKELYVDSDAVVSSLPSGPNYDGHIAMDTFSKNYSADLPYTNIYERAEFFKYNGKTFGDRYSNWDTTLRDVAYSSFNGGSNDDSTVRTATISSETGTSSRGIHSFGALISNNRYRIFGFCL